MEPVNMQKHRGNDAPILVSLEDIGPVQDTPDVKFKVSLRKQQTGIGYGIEDISRHQAADQKDCNVDDNERVRDNRRVARGETHLRDLSAHLRGRLPGGFAVFLRYVLRLIAGLRALRWGLDFGKERGKIHVAC